MATFRPAVFWFYGLSGAGKTTLSTSVARELKAQGVECLVLDGDVFRAGISADLGFSPEDREENIRRAAEVAKLACQQGQVVLAAFITPTAALRDRARGIITLPFYEVFLDCDYETGSLRDAKGLYAQASVGKLKDFSGHDAVFERPTAPELQIDSQRLGSDACLVQALAFVKEQILIPASGYSVLPGSDQTPFADPVTDQMAAFLRGIGLPVLHGRFDQSFLPGLALDNGRIVIDEERLLYPGDVLHEAGHLAVTPAADRSQVGGNLAVGMGDEIGAIIWSYAAALHLGIDPAIVFHPHGYRNSSSAFLENFREGRYVGVPLLQWMGMTYDEAKGAELGVPPFPHMIQWLRS